MLCADFPPVFVFGLEDGHVAALDLLLSGTRYLVHALKVEHTVHYTPGTPVADN